MQISITPIMKFNQLQQKSETELKQLLVKTREKIRDLRFKIASRQHKDLRDLREARKLVAQIMTLFNSKKKKDN